MLSVFVYSFLKKIKNQIYGKNNNDDDNDDDDDNYRGFVY